MLVGLSTKQREAFGLKDASSHKYTEAGAGIVPLEVDALGWEETLEGMDTLGLQGEMVEGLWACLAIVILLGDLQVNLKPPDCVKQFLYISMLQWTVSYLSINVTKEY